jgi:predicted transcriptional regulator
LEEEEENIVMEEEENRAQGELRYVYQRREKKYAYSTIHAKLLVPAFSNS